MLKIEELKKALEAVEANNEYVNFEDWLAVVQVARDAYHAEYDKALRIRDEYEAMPETDCGSGICNAQDTYPQDENGRNAAREISVEFWTCARDSLQMMRDDGNTTGL